MSQERRLRKAQEETQKGKPCSRCGHAPGVPVEYNVVWEALGIEEEDPKAAEEEETHCKECGKQLVYEITWGDEDEEYPPHVISWIQHEREKARAKAFIEDP